MDAPTTHALLRDRRDWLGERRGLAIDRDGVLALARTPAPGGGKAVEIATGYPYTRAVSGIATDLRDALFVADTAHDRVLYVDGLCNSQSWLPAESGALFDAPGHFKAPRGLAIAPDSLLVADSGNARVQSLALPRLEANIAYALWAEPTSLAADSHDRILVVDGATRSVHRLRSNRMPDAAFDAKLAAHADMQFPLFVACDADDRVLVSDAAANQVFVFDADGNLALVLTGAAGWMPGALATCESRLYVADARSGAICVFENDALIGEVSGWRGPITALTTNAAGDLFIKPGLDATYFRFAADAAYLLRGELTAGPFDAGEEREWERAWADAQLPTGTSVMLSVGLKPAAAPPPASTDWIALPSLDSLLAQQTSGNRRFIWLRLELATDSALLSPRIAQTRAATAAENLMKYLPLTYSLNDADGFLLRWVKLLRGQFSAIEELLDDMPRACDSRLARASSLPWLAQWLALELPQIANDDERRELLARTVKLFARRGTKESIAEFVELYTGIRPAIIEAFNDRRIWMLGVTSQLGFDTRLAPFDPFGMVVPAEDAGDGCCPPISTAAKSCTPCSTAASAVADAPRTLSAGAIGRAIVGESGLLASYQIGFPLFAEDAYRFCVVVDAYRACDPAVRREIARIVDREKPAHTDYRIEFIAPETRIGLQARIGIDAILGGDPPPMRLAQAQLGFDSQLPPADVARIGQATLDGQLTLN